jgi:hypothetical protein
MQNDPSKLLRTNNRAETTLMPAATPDDKIT